MLRHACIGSEQLNPHAINVIAAKKEKSNGLCPTTHGRVHTTSRILARSRESIRDSDVRVRPE
jgi:hypothetical protein